MASRNANESGNHRFCKRSSKECGSNYVQHDPIDTTIEPSYLTLLRLLFMLLSRVIHRTTYSL